MGKEGKIKNGNNKAKHTKLLNQKKNRLREAKALNKQRLKAIISKKVMLEKPCPCNNNKTYKECCFVGHENIDLIESAEQLMRSRYTAFVLGNIEYLMSSHHSSTRPIDEKDEILKWSKAVKWMGLEVLNCTKGLKDDNQGTVEFKAFFEEYGKAAIIHENSKFVKENEHWVYLGEV